MSTSADPPAPAPASGGLAEGELPRVVPTPQHMVGNGPALTVRGRIQLGVTAEVSDPARELVGSVLEEAGAGRVDVVDIDDVRRRPGQLTVIAGTVGHPAVDDALRAAGGEVPADLPAEGYALASKAARDGGVVAIGGADPDGIYYAAQTLRQLVAGRALAAVSITDFPLMQLRGSIEGFYGQPWSHEERLDQLAFYGDVKANTYVYAPKDDPYHRDQWREPYPADLEAQLGELVQQAIDHHVRFTFAMSPGVSICYSDPGDLDALLDKLQAMYDLGARSFSIALDDITYDEWNCPGDEDAYGEPSPGAAGQAQVDLLNVVKRDFIDGREGTHPMQFVPTEYDNVAETPYKRIIREQLDESVEVMWTGTDVVPPSISVDEAAEAAEVWGRPVFIWDNYPVNDYWWTTGRLLMGPYSKREAGLHTQVSGILLNPMNQASASKVALFGGADFSWNDVGYEPYRTWEAAADYLSGDDTRTTQALLAFFDLQHLAPTFWGDAWLPVAPELDRRLERFDASWAAGEHQAALDELRPYAELLAGAPELIAAGVADPIFHEDIGPWMESLALWSAALLATLDGLQARVDGDEDAANQRFADAAELIEAAGEVETVPGKTRPEGVVKMGDGVLDVFLTAAPGLRP
ncbi:beta-N-acetylhexosaminidase family protein [Phytoactinopolyspora mesophila]|nr:beta-N-acetylglucosaminidase domain-containing protein [Phytoactinopolyspora mesophila]